MDQIKTLNCEREGEVFPIYRELSALECALLRRKFIAALGLPGESADRALIDKILTLTVTLPENVEPCDRFDFEALLKRHGVNPSPEILLDWGWFDEVDEMSLKDFSEHFSDIWYPSSDDLGLFDSSMSWMLLITHYGALMLWKQPITAPAA